MIKHLLFILFTIVILAMAAIEESILVNKILVQKSKKIAVVKRNSMTSFNQTLINTQKLYTFRHRHSQLVKFLASFNTNLVSPYFFVYIFTGLIFNILCSLFLYLYETITLLRYMLYVYLVFQIVLPVAIAIVLSRLNCLLNGSANHLLTSLLQLNNYFLRSLVASEMLKSESYFEALNQLKMPFALTAGIFGQFTRRIIMEFGLLYVVVAMKILTDYF